MPILSLLTLSAPNHTQNRRLNAIDIPKRKWSAKNRLSVHPFQPIPIHVDKDYNGSISGGEIVLYRVDYLKTSNETKALRIKLSSDKSRKVMIFINKFG